MNDVMKGDNVIVFELFEKRGFSNGGEGCPFRNWVEEFVKFV